MSPTVPGFRAPIQTTTPRARRRRAFTARLEAVEDRMLLTSLASVDFTLGGVTHSEVFALNFDNTVSMSKDGGSFTNIGGYAKSLAAGLDTYGYPEVYAIGGDNAVWQNDNNAGWVSRGGWVSAISAAPINTVIGIGSDNAVWVNRGGSSWSSWGGWAKSISVGTDGYGLPEAYVIGSDNAVWQNDNGVGWNSRGGVALAIAGSSHNSVFAIGTDNAVYLNRGGSAWTNLHGYARSIVAGSDGWQNPVVYVIGSDNAVYVSQNGSGYTQIGGYVTEMTPTRDLNLFVRGGSIEQLFVSRNFGGFGAVGGALPVANPAAATSYSPAPAGTPLFNNGQPSYLDMEQGATGDCWLDSSLAEVAYRAPQDIRNMFSYRGTTVDHGSTVDVYLVRLYSPTGIAGYFQVDTALPSGGAYYNRVTNALGTRSLWSALAEKAYAEANALGFVTTSAPGQGSYAALNAGWPNWALQAIVGNASAIATVNPANAANAWNAGQFVVFCTTTPSSSLIVSSHCYAMVGYDPSSGVPYKLFNPWGTQSDGYAPGQTGKVYGLFNANASFVSQNFSSQAFATGTVNPGLAVGTTETPAPLTVRIKKRTPDRGLTLAPLVVDSSLPTLES